MVHIKLHLSEWEYEPNNQLGQDGGFGAVFVGRNTTHNNVAIKRLHLRANDLAHRELKIANVLVQRNLKHVIPVLDAGQDADSDAYFIVMALAEKSLQQEINNQAVINDLDAVHILKDIVAGLQEVSDIVHRDLKPANVLYHEGHWKLADFGIARFVEDSTSLNTLNGFLSRDYASPEQWRIEHTIPATDVYALGCIGYALLTGKPPYTGFSREDYKKQHLTGTPIPLPEKHPAQLRSLLTTMLRKEPATRPTLTRIRQQLEDIASGIPKSLQNTGFQALAQAGVDAAQYAVAQDAAQIDRQTKQQSRTRLLQAAIPILDTMVETLFERVIQVAPTAERIQTRTTKNQAIRLGSALLEIELLNNGVLISEDAFERSGWDVVVGAQIQVQQSSPRPYEWGGNLWYTNLGTNSEYRWWEVIYMSHPLSRTRRSFEPFAVDDIEDADRAASPIMDTIQFAAKPRPIDDENLDEFCARWAELLAKAYRGQLTHPSYLPLD
ncbi:MAG: serine/threonine protein kinase [Anaerolineae bacterium]|nr:serine/threonine protein kinase [Anaerolineae bacterium]